MPTERGLALVLIDNKLYYKTERKQERSYNVKTGVVVEEDVPVYVSKGLLYESAANKVPLEADAISETGLRLLNTLARHQVEGDEVVKGLRALGWNVNFKIVKNYLGGWTFPDNDDLTIEEFCNSFKD